MIRFPESMEIFTTSKCNLKCNYCYISKNKSLIEYDKHINDCHNDLIYFNKIKDFYLNNENKLKLLSLWGGEPTIGMSKFCKTLPKYLETFPKLNEIHFSSNMSYNNKGIYDLLNVLSKYKDRAFFISLQVSIDGPPNINNFSRNNNGKKDLNEIIINNILSLIDFYNKNDYKNVLTEIHFKPTLNMDIINQFLKEETDIIDYFKYFEYMYDLFMKNNNSINLKFQKPTPPNIAVPGNYTVEDGRTFSLFTNKCRSILNGNKSPFKYYKSLLWFQGHLHNVYDDLKNKTFSQNDCSACKGQFCIDSNDKLHGCHRGFLDSNDLYIKHSCELKDLEVMEQNKRQYILSKHLTNFEIDKLKEDQYYQQRILDIKESHEMYMSSAIALIYELSLCGLISECYRYNSELRFLAAMFILKIDACIQDSAMIHGSYYLKNPSLAKLFLNGAIDEDLKLMLKREKENH